MIKQRTLLDTNILVYGWDTSSKYYTKTANFLETLGEFYISDRSLLEFYRVYTGPLKTGVEDTLEIVNYYLSLSQCTILYSKMEDIFSTFELASEHKARSGKIFDLNILATALENNIDIIYTKNIKDFPEIEEIKIIDPTV